VSKVLLICYYFPPLGGAGVSRPLALFKHLPKHDIDCDILTVKPVVYRVNEPELLNGLDITKIYRSGSFDPQRLMYLMGMRRIKDETIDDTRKFAKRFFPDPKVRWVSKAVRLGRTLVENKRHKAIISTSPPISTHLVAKKLSKEFKIPWIADFRDIWTSYTPEQWHDSDKLIKKAKNLLSEIVDSADAVTGINDSILNYLGKGKLIHNSFDSDLAKMWSIPSKPNNFTVGLLGTIDKLTPVEPLFKLLNEFKNVHPENFSRIRICQVGRINLPEFDTLVKRYQLEDRINIHGFKDRVSTVNLLNDASVFYLGVDREAGNHITTSRIFDMLASGRQILASAPDNSEIANLLNTKNCGFIFNENDIKSAVEYINKLINTYSPGNIKPLPDYALEYSSDKMVNQFVELINSIIDK
jgi:glycosyltransferase involved in cell wall biosynthesis